MRILVVSDQWYPEYAGGAARVATETAAGLAARGHAVAVLVPRAPGLPQRSETDGVTVHRLLHRSPLPKTFTDIVETARHVRKTGEFDVALVHQSTTAAGLRLARPRLPFVYVYHASAARELRFARPRLGLAKRAATYGLVPCLRVAEAGAARRAASVLVLSGFSEELFRSDHPSLAGKAKRVSGGVDVDAFTPAEERSAAALPGRRLLTVRRLDPRMGLEPLIRSMVLLPEDTRLELVGSGPLEGKLRALVRELGLTGRVELFGRVEDDELRRRYREADLFVLPTVAYEGFGMATLEALASGTPVVGTRVGATPELLEPLEPRLLAAGTGPEHLAAAIGSGLDLLATDLRERCRAYVRERFAWERVLPAWEDALAEAAGGA